MNKYMTYKCMNISFFSFGRIDLTHTISETTTVCLDGQVIMLSTEGENSDVHSIVAFSPDNRKCIFIRRLIHVGTGIRFHFTGNKITRLAETIHSISFLTCCRNFQRSGSVLITLRYKTFNVTRFTLAASLLLKNFEVCRKESPIFFSTFARVIL